MRISMPSSCIYRSKAFDMNLNIECAEKDITMLNRNSREEHFEFLESRFNRLYDNIPSKISQRWLILFESTYKNEFKLVSF